jgi:hypothetical protein
MHCFSKKDVSFKISELLTRLESLNKSCFYAAFSRNKFSLWYCKGGSNNVKAQSDADSLSINVSIIVTDILFTTLFFYDDSTPRVKNKQ